MGEPTKKLTYGQRLVGLRFNPSKKDIVTETKQSDANVIDALNAIVENSEDPIQVELAKNAIAARLAAQMLAVKTFTWEANQ